MLFVKNLAPNEGKQKNQQLRNNAHFNRWIASCTPTSHCDGHTQHHRVILQHSDVPHIQYVYTRDKSTTSACAEFYVREDAMVEEGEARRLFAANNKWRKCGLALVLSRRTDPNGCGNDKHQQPSIYYVDATSIKKPLN